MSAEQTLISVRDAERLIAEHGAPFGTVRLHLNDCVGRVLHEDVVSDRDQPPFHRVAMDGIAIRFASWESGRREFPIEGTHHAGEPAPTLQYPDGCYEVMTGSVLPQGCDCVIRVEDVHVANGAATLSESATAGPMQNVHQHGSDRSAGDTLIGRSARLTSPHIAIAASVGMGELRVDREPAIALVSNGDELVDVHESVAPYQIRRSNVYAVESALRRGGHTDLHRFHLPDEQVVVERGLEQILEDHSVLLLSGGVSAGQHDFIPGALQKLGVRPVFHKVLQRPGLPFWFGVAEGNKQVFAMPGNPVSTLICFYRYVVPQLAINAGLPREPQFAVLGEDTVFKKDLTLFLPVSLAPGDGGLCVAEPRPTHGSGDFCGLAPTDGFVELPAAADHFPSGTICRLYRW